MTWPYSHLRHHLQSLAYVVDHTPDAPVYLVFPRNVLDVALLVLLAPKGVQLVHLVTATSVDSLND